MSISSVQIDRFVELLRRHNEGRLSAAEVLEAAQAHHPRPAASPHFLWSRLPRHGGPVIHYWFQELTENKLYEILSALVAETPNIPAITDSDGMSFLDVALGHYNVSPACSGRVLLLLVHGEVARSRRTRHPLHVACSRRGMDPEVIRRLVDLDPDCLTVPEANPNVVPLHYALATHLARIPDVVQAMVSTRPDSLLCRDFRGQTPVAYGLDRLREWELTHDPETPPEAAAAAKAAEASLLTSLVVLRPGSVVPSGATAMPDHLQHTALWVACWRYPSSPDFLAEIIRAYPPALCVASVGATTRNREPPRLPFEAAADATARAAAAAAATTQTSGAVAVSPIAMEKETLHMALAVIEYVIGAAAFADPNAVGFQQHTKQAVAAIVSADGYDDLSGSLSASSGFAVARAVHSRVSNSNSSIRAADLLRALFCRDDVPRLLRGNDPVRDTVMGRTAADLYRMNRRGRFDVVAAAPPLSAAHRHVDLVGLVSDNVECVYLHVRENWVHILPPHHEA
jgi:hypothetical protein